MSSARTRLRGIATSSFVSSSTYVMLRSSRYFRNSSRRQSRTGRTIVPCRGYIAASPRGPAPRTSRSRKVSAWSSRVWPSATTSAPNCRRARSKNSYRSRRAASSSDRPDKLAELALQEPNRWREVALLAAAKAGRGTALAIWTLAETLCDKPAPVAREHEERGYWGALLAAQALVENQCLMQIAPRDLKKLERIRQWLVRTLEHEALPPVDRAQAGDALAVLGDPRFRADAWLLPDEPWLGFVEVDAGDFLMGSDRKQDQYAEEERNSLNTL